MPFTPFLSPFEQCPSVDLVYLGFTPLFLVLLVIFFTKRGNKQKKMVRSYKKNYLVKIKIVLIKALLEL